MRSFSNPISRIAPLAEETSTLRRLANVHWGPAAAALLLSLVGLATIHSASAELATDFASRQALWTAVGVAALVAAFLVDYRALVDASPFLYAAALACLVVVLWIGREAGGARSWLSVGAVGFQPSELAKLATALYLARYLATVQRPRLRPREIAWSAAVVAVPAVLVALERDLGGAAMFAPLLAGVLLVAGVRMRHVALALAAVALLAAAVWSFGMHDYQRQRIRTFLAPGSDPLGAGYQLRQSKIAVGSGELTGQGYGRGIQSQLRFLPERHTDFIMAVLAEEWGFLGVAVVLALYALYVDSAARIARRGRDRAGMLLVAGLLSVFTLHVLYNTAMVIGLLPVTGVPLPFLSYGGSFALANFVATGMILSVDARRHVNR